METIRGCLGIRLCALFRPKRVRPLPPFGSPAPALLTSKLEPESPSDDSRFYCGRCDRRLSWDELVEVSECHKCGHQFDATTFGPACPECRTTDARRLTDQGCPECLEQADL